VRRLAVEREEIERRIPIRRMIDAGLFCTLGSDHPPMFGTDLAGEYRLLGATVAAEPGHPGAAFLPEAVSGSPSRRE
jgi:hypothetical protein